MIGMSIVKILVLVLGIVLAGVVLLVTRKLAYRWLGDAKKAWVLSWVAFVVVVLIVAAMVLTDVV